MTEQDYEVVLRKLDAANRRLFAWLVFAVAEALLWMFVAIMALLR